MYNFRYHLVTIVSIFAALIIGLLLGVALTGSDLVRDASSNLAQSLTAEFEELNAENDTLQKQLQIETQFADEVLASWKSDRLKGRTVVIFERDAGQSAALTSALSGYVSESGGIPVIVRLNATEGLGLDDEQRLTALKRIVDEVDGEEYSTTVARALAAEWSFAITDEDTIITSIFDQNYQLTDYLVALGAISVSVDYASTITAIEQAQTADAHAFSTDLVAYNQAQRLQLPYAVNGVIDTAIASDGEDVQFDADVLRISAEFEALGRSGMLPYLDLTETPITENQQTETGTSADQTGEDGNTALGGETIESTEPTAEEDEQTQATPPAIPENANYFVLLVSRDDHANAALSAAQSTGIACVFTPFSPLGHYNVIALMSGGDKGSYGNAHQGIAEFVPAPGDGSGLLPFG